jgi:hypothetical protein
MTTMFGRNPIAAAALTALAAALAPTGVFAQPVPSVDAAGTCPRDEDLARLNPEIDFSARSQALRTGSPVRSNVPLYRNQSLTGARVEKPDSSYDDDLVVMAGARLGTTGPALVRRIGRTGEDVCGWMDVRDLERSATPLNLVNLPGFGGTLDRAQRPNKLIARVVVKNRVDQQTGNPQRAPIFREPFDGPEPTEQLGHVGYFEVLSVFEVRKKNGTCRSLTEDGCFLRVGSSDVGRSRGNAEGTRTRGWMLGKDVEVWPSPLALYYKPGAEGIKIHATEPSARTGTPYGDRGAETRVLAFQPQGRYVEPHDINIMRFPVIRGSLVGAQRTPPRPGEQPATPYVYEVVFSGQACLSGGEDCIPEPRIKAEIASITGLQEKVSKIDVLFVVDATESMGPYRRSVVAAIRKQVDDLATSGNASLRHSVVLYGDYNETRDDKLDYYLLPFSPVNDRSGIERLASEGFFGTFKDIHKDLPEAPFAALERAISEASWRPDAAQRLIIWIADHGNRPPGTYRTNGGYTLVENKTAENVIKAIQNVDKQMKLASPSGQGTNTRFVALQVKGASRASNEQWFTKFVTDARTIQTALGEVIFQTIPAPANISAEAEINALRDAIAAQIGRNVNAATWLREAVERGLGGDTAMLQENLPKSLLAREYLEQLGFSVARLVEIGKHIQIVQRGFVFQSSADGDFRYWLGMRRPEFNNFRESVKELCDSLPYSEREEAIEDAILKLVKLLTFGEPQPGQNLRDYLARVLSVPADHISTVLEGTPDQFVRRLGRPADRTAVITKVCRSAKLLNMVGEGQIVDNPAQDIVVATEGPSITQASLRQGVTPRSFDWRWTSPDARAQWFFVPMDYLP